MLRPHRQKLFMEIDFARHITSGDCRVLVRQKRYNQVGLLIFVPIKVDCDDTWMHNPRKECSIKSHVMFICQDDARVVLYSVIIHQIIHA